MSAQERIYRLSRCCTRFADCRWRQKTGLALPLEAQCMYRKHAYHTCSVQNSQRRQWQGGTAWSHQPGGKGVGPKSGCSLQQAVQRGKSAHAKELARQRGHQAPVAPKGEARRWGGQPQQLQAGRGANQAHPGCQPRHAHQEGRPAHSLLSELRACFSSLPQSRQDTCARDVNQGTAAHSATPRSSRAQRSKRPSKTQSSVPCSSLHICKPAVCTLPRGDSWRRAHTESYGLRWVGVCRQQSCTLCQWHGGIHLGTLWRRQRASGKQPQARRPAALKMEKSETSTS